MMFTHSHARPVVQLERVRLTIMNLLQSLDDRSHTCGEEDGARLQCERAREQDVRPKNAIGQ